MIFDLFAAYRRAFRLWMRTKTRPISIEEAEEKSLFLSKIYAVSGLIAIAFCTFYTASHNINFNFRKDIPADVATVKSLNSDVTSMRIIKIRGFKKESDVTYSDEEIEKIMNKSADKPKSESEL